MMTQEQSRRSNRSSPEIYKETRDHYLSNAVKLMENKKYRKASELFWGAITQAIKLLASLDGRYMVHHSEIEDYVEEISKKTKDPNLLTEFQRLSILHTNFYDPVIADKRFIFYHKDTMRFLSRIEKLVNIRIREKQITL